MSEGILIPRNAILAVLLALAAAVLLLIVQQIPDIRREIKMWMM